MVLGLHIKDIIPFLKDHCLNNLASVAHKAKVPGEDTEPPIAYATGSLFVELLRILALNKP
jgi:hypothetical protein